MKFERRFRDAVSYLNEYMPEVQNTGSDTSQFFLNLDDDSNRALQRGYSLDEIGAPKGVIEMEKAAKEVSSLPLVYKNAHEEMTLNEKHFFINTKKRKIEQVYNFTDVFSSLKNAYDIDSIVDMACGVGHLGRYMAFAFPDTSVIGVDKNEEFIEAAKKRSKGNDANLDFVVGDAHDSYDQFMLGKNNAVVSLHGCGLITHSVLSADDAKLIAASPCCYHNIEPEDYFMSEFARNKDIAFLDEELGQIANLGSGSLISKVREEKRRGLAEKIKNNNYTISEKDTRLLQSMGLDYNVSEKNFEYVADSIHNLKMRHSLLKKIVSKPAEMMLSADKAISLQERGYDAKVMEYVPLFITPRNHLIMGYK